MPNLEDMGPLAAAISGGDRAALARGLRIADDAPPMSRALCGALGSASTIRPVVGVTGHPGAGKSTLIDALITAFRAQGNRVGVIAVDPSSPFSGGAILGDRIRMASHFGDPGVFVRSFASRGVLGGLSHATEDALCMLSAAGFDTLIIETVGVGQDEVDVARTADTTLVVLVPGMGDDIQAFKAGLLEIADVFVLNKADRPGIDDLERNLRNMIALAPPGPWSPPLVRAVATRQEGVSEILLKVQRHRDFLASDAARGRLSLRRRHRFDRLMDAALLDRERKRVDAQLTQAGHAAEGGEDPYLLVDRVLAATGTNTNEG